MLSEALASLEAISATFVTFMQKELLYSSILFLLVLGLTRLLKRKSVYLPYGLWALVFVRLILPPDWSLNFSARSLVDRFDLWDNKADETLVLNHEIDSGIATTTAAETWRDNQEAVSQPVMVSNAESAGISPVSWRGALFLLWLIGAISFAVIFLKHYWYYLRVIRRSETIADPTLLKLAATWSRRYEIKRSTRFVSSDICLSPFTVGVFRPTVYLPRVLLAQSKIENLESVVAHELAHIKQLDDLWIKFQNVVQLVYFFHPLVWLTNSRLNQSRERICDELVLSYGTISPKAYGKSMLAILKMNLLGPEGVEMLPGFGNHKKKFSARIKEITTTGKTRKSNRVGSYVLIAVLALFLLPMAQRMEVISASDGSQIIVLKRAIDVESDFKIHTYGAGSRFQKISLGKSKDIFCESQLPKHLKDIEFAAMGLYDTDYRKIWLLKGKTAKGGMEFYMDTNGDQCFTDEEPLKVKKKTAKYQVEGDSEWVLSKYLKSQVMVDYHYKSGNETRQAEFPVYLVYDWKKNFLQFENNDFWIGQAKLGAEKYDIALYGGLQSGWYLRPTFDETPNAATKNELRIDFDSNKVFAAMTVFDPATNEVVQENYPTAEPILVNGKLYEVKGIWHKGEHLEVKIVPKAGVTEVGSLSRSKS